MRAVWSIVAVLLVALLGVVAFLGGDRGRTPGGVLLPDALDSAGVEPVRRIEVSIPPAEQETRADVAEKQTEGGWQRCLDEPNRELLRACIRAWLVGRSLGPAELAALACAQTPLGAAQEILVTEAAVDWPVAETAANIRAFHALCDDPGEFWPEVLDRRCAENPRWCAAFAATLDPESVFADDDTILLALANRLADHGDVGLRRLLEEGAGGAWGGSTQHVVFALRCSVARLTSLEERLEFLRDVARAPAFPGRDAEVDALLACALDVEGEPAASVGSIGFVQELLRDPRLGRRAAAELLRLEEEEELPRNVVPADLRALLELAREIVGSQ